MQNLIMSLRACAITIALLLLKYSRIAYTFFSDLNPKGGRMEVYVIKTRKFRYLPENLDGLNPKKLRYHV